MPLSSFPSSNLTLVIDQGSHSSRIAIFSETGELVYLKSRPVSTHSTDNSGQSIIYEQNAEDILQSIQILLADLPNNLSKDIRCCGLCTQRSTIVAWHKGSGKTLSPAISWRDTRGQSLVKKLTPFSSKIRRISGLPLSAHYSATKIHWLLQNNTAVKQADKEKQLCISPLASYLLFHLLNEKPIIIDHSNAQRCQLFDTQNLNWSDELLEIYQIEKHVLPECAPVNHCYGTLRLDNIPLTAVCGDQNAVLYAYPPLQENNALVNIGTGAFILSTSTERYANEPNLLQTLTSSDDQSVNFVTEGTVNGAGAALSWAQNNEKGEDIYSQLPYWLRQVKSPPIFINNISKLGSPWWCDAGEPEFIGKHTPTRAERYAAIIESILFLIFNNIQQLSVTPKTLFISGGLSQLDTLCQKLADLSQAKILRFSETEATARGGAWLANQSLGNNHLKWKSLEISQQFKATDDLSEQRKICERYQQFVGELNKRCGKD